MDALLMAGGMASRMGGREKSLALLSGKPLIAYVIDALLGSAKIGQIYIAVSPRVPLTSDHLAAVYKGERRIALVATPGAGYVEDTAYAVQALRLFRPFLILSADLPLVTTEIIDKAVSRYEESGAEALSVRVNASCLPPGVEPDIVLTDGGGRSVPAGINVIDGRHMGRPQEELVLLVSDARLVANVNYPEDLAACERMMREGRGHR